MQLTTFRKLLLATVLTTLTTGMTGLAFVQYAAADSLADSGASASVASVAPAAAPAALTDIPPQRQAVVDLTGTLSSAALDALTAKAHAVKDQTGAQMSVLLVPSLNGETIDAYADRAAQAWHVGAEGEKAVLLAVAFTEHGVKLVATRNLADHLDGHRADEVIATALVPEFRQGHIQQGLANAMDAIQADLSGPPALEADSTASTGGPTSASSALGSQSSTVAGNALLRVLEDDPLALGLMVGALVLMAAFVVISRMRSDRALRRSLVRAHAEKEGARLARMGTVSQRSALDKSVTGKPNAFGGTLAKARLTGLRDTRLRDEPPAATAPARSAASETSPTPVIAPATDNPH